MTVHVFRRDTCVLTGPMDDIWHSLINEYEYNAADLLVFDGKTGRVIDIDPNAPPSRSDNTPHEPARTGGRGRPKLGVVSKEVTLLPRHWDWLAKQRGGASATLRRLVDEARKANPSAGSKKDRQTAAYTFMTAMAGDRPGFEEAIRCLFRDDIPGMEEHMRNWPVSVREIALNYLQPKE